MLEDQIEIEVVNKAERAGYEVRKVQWIGRRGAMDRVFFGYGKCIWIEFKAPGKEPEGQQAREVERLRKKYPHIHVCDNVADALAILGVSDG
jgi:hypothetical protein